MAGVAQHWPGGTGVEAGATGYSLGDAFGWVPSLPYERHPGDPLCRSLRVYTLDPSFQRNDGATATLEVPYEPLEPGPQGLLFQIDNRNVQLGLDYRSADLDEPNVLIADGYAPSQSDPRFHQQMVYAVASKVHLSFRQALGRDPAWGFGNACEPARLRLYPHYGDERNAYYCNDGREGEIRFGYYKADARPTDATLPGGYVFTCLSHDIIAHEISHALLDGLRPCFCTPAGPDVPAFHEAFADLVAIFQHFSYREVLVAAIRHCKGKLEHAQLLTQLARQFGHTTGYGNALRCAIEPNLDAPSQYDPQLTAHKLGTVLVSAVFEAFARIFARKTERLIRLASNGSGILPPGEIPHDLQILLADKASQLAGEFLNICIRAIDYCPPVAIDFGDYLRALITADHDAVPDDNWNYRGALIDSFRRRNIYPRGVANLSEDALLWRSPRQDLPAITNLDFASLRFRGDPGHAASLEELRRQAHELGRYMCHAQRLEEFGLVRADDPRLGRDRVSPPCIQSIRTARRVGPHRKVLFDLVAEVTQERHVAPSSMGPGFTLYGGATLILGPSGEVRYTIIKRVAGHGRLERQRAFLQGQVGNRFWAVQDGFYKPRDEVFRLVHADCEDT